MSLIAGFVVPHPPIIIPEVGKGEERKIQLTVDAYHTIAQEIAQLKPETIIISSPHSTMYGDYFHVASDDNQKGSLRQFGARKVEFDIVNDVELVESIQQHATKLDFPMGILGNQHADLDHGVIIPLYFIRKYYTNFKVLHVSPSGLPLSDHYKAGKYLIDAIASNKRVVWVASGDLSHKLKEDGPYGLSTEGPLFDEQITSALAKANFMALLQMKPTFCRHAAECGLGSFTMMAGALDGFNVESKLLSYEGPFGVGYAVASFYPKNQNPHRELLSKYKIAVKETIIEKQEQEDEYVQLARMSIESFVKHTIILPVPDSLDHVLLNNKAGVFVSIHKEGRLRGCIGTIKPTQESIALEIIHNAISAATRDFRFRPIQEEELPLLEISVDVLASPEPISSLSELDVKKYGVIVRFKHKSGLLLPNLEGIDTVKEQVRIARHKAGIRETEPYTLERFEVIRHG